MNLLLVSGFLGSGKTTLVVQLAKAAAEQGRRSAVLVNEIGEIGIDNQLMRQLDLDVWELTNGCICCTLSSDLVVTLEKLDKEYQTGLVFVEPSGAADPKSILNALPYYKGKPLESIRTVSILDPLRLSMLYEVMTPLITNQVTQADLILISKCDLASEDEVDYAVNTARELNTHAGVYRTNLRQVSPDLLSEILQ